MKTPDRVLKITPHNVKNNTAVLSYDPFTADISCKKLMLEFDQNGGYEWEENDYLILDLEFTADSRTFVHCDFYTNGESIINLNYSIIPNHRIKVVFSMQEMKSDRFYLTPYPGNLKGHNTGKVTHISKIDKVALSTTNVKNGGKIIIYGAYLSNELPDFTVCGDIMVDKFGQNAQAEFDGKIRNEQELCEYIESEYEKALCSKGYCNPDWNSYGGYTKIRFDKTGYFNTHYDGKRWWLVDPDGCAFLSNGVCYGTRMGVHGFVDGMENLFEWLPDKDDKQFKNAWSLASSIPEFIKRNGEQAGKTRKMFNFARANMIRVFGNDWWEKWVTINSARLKEWGFNTISVCVNNYFDENVYDYLKKAKIPYTWTLKKFPKTSKMIFRDFPDVFSDEYKQLCAEFAKQLEPLSDDPYMIGYFINNEPEWIVSDRVNIAERLITSDQQLESKKELIKFLKNKYTTVDAFNKAWEFDISEFDELFSPVDENTITSAGAKADLEEFRQIMISAYNRIPVEAVKVYAPNNMCLGMRYPHVKEGSFAGSEFYDSFSFNCYSRHPADMFEIANKCTKTPFMVGEWHYGSYDTTHLCSALVSCKDETERGKACSNYIKTAFSNYQLVGAHYFEYNDQPYLGRFDGEAMPHGLISVTNRPYSKCLEYFAKANRSLYEIALGTDDIEYYDVEFTESF